MFFWELIFKFLRLEFENIYQLKFCYVVYQIKPSWILKRMVLVSAFYLDSSMSNLIKRKSTKAPERTFFNYKNLEIKIIILIFMEWPFDAGPHMNDTHLSPHSHRNVRTPSSPGSAARRRLNQLSDCLSVWQPLHVQINCVRNLLLLYLLLISKSTETVLQNPPVALNRQATYTARRVHIVLSPHHTPTQHTQEVVMFVWEVGGTQVPAYGGNVYNVCG